MSRCLAVLSLTIVTLAIGCHCGRCRSFSVSAPPCPPPCPPGVAVPANRPPFVAPPPATYAPQYSPPPVIQGQHNYQPPVQQPPHNANQTWRPAPSDANYGRDATATDPTRPNTKLLPPADEKPRAKLQPPETEDSQGKVRISQDNKSPDYPHDVDQLKRVAVVPGEVYAGLQPHEHGWLWLKEHGFRTVLNLRPAEDDTSPRTNTESKGMVYVSLEVTPEKLDRDLVTRFGVILKDQTTHPLFVYDRRGMLKGTMFYLHFRLNEKMPDAQARSEAVKLGLKEEVEGGYETWWLKINKLLEGSPNS